MENNKLIIVFSGTSDSVEIIKLLLENKYSIIACVATDEGEKMLSTINNIIIKNSRLDENNMINFFKDKKIFSVVDASHPYAENVSKIAMNVCKLFNINYIRYERPSEFSINYYDKSILVESYKEAVDYINNMKGNVLITTGVNYINEYKRIFDFDKRVFVRILNNMNSFNRVKSIGLGNNNIISGDGRYTLQDNIDIIKKYNINILITKDTGKAGGFIEKMEACNFMNIFIIIIRRPILLYRNKTENIYDILNLLSLKE